MNFFFFFSAFVRGNSLFDQNTMKQNNENHMIKYEGLNLFILRRDTSIYVKTSGIVVCRDDFNQEVGNEVSLETTTYLVGDFSIRLRQFRFIF